MAEKFTVIDGLLNSYLKIGGTRAPRINTLGEGLSVTDYRGTALATLTVSDAVLDTQVPTLGQVKSLGAGGGGTPLDPTKPLVIGEATLDTQATTLGQVKGLVSAGGGGTPLDPAKPLIVGEATLDTQVPTLGQVKELVSAGGGGGGTVETITYDGKTLAEVLDTLTYIAPVILSFSNSVGIVELGQVIDNITFSWSLNKAVTTQSIDQGIGAIAVGTVSQELTAQGLIANKTWELSVNDGKTTVAKSTSILFRNKRYWGTSDLTTLADADVLTLNGELATSRVQSRVLDCTGGKYMYFAVPTSFSCDTSKFKVGGLASSAWEVVTRDMVNASGHSENYTIFRSTNIQTGSSIAVDVV